MENNMDLAELKFIVNTDQLVAAKTAIDALGVAVSKVNKPVTEAAKESEKLAQAQAKTAKATAEAELAVTKAALAAEKLGQAQQKSSDSTSKSVSILERQNLILEYMAQGNSKGQASIMATFKAAGALDSEMQQLNDTLKIQRTLIGGDPFDKSIGLMQKLQNEFKTTDEVNKLFNQGLGLTEKQMIDLAREKERLIALYGIEGRDIKGLTAEYNALIQKSVEINGANAARTNSMRDQVKAQTDAAKANAYITSEMDKLNRLTEANGNITSGTNNKQIKFEQALKASGKTAEEQAALLKKYNDQLLTTQKHAGNRQVDYLSRALGPQITDIAVGLATGQSPMMVLLQQGGQLRDQFALAGVAGKDMGDMLTKAAASMVTSVKDVGVAISSAIVGSFMSAGKAVTTFIADMTGISAGVKALKQMLVGELGMGARGAIGIINLVGTALTAVAGVAIVGIIGALVAYGIALKKVSDQEESANKTAALYGGQLGLTKDKVLGLSKEYAGIKGNVGDYIEAINDAAQAGNIQASALNVVTTAAINLAKVGGPSVKDTMKQFSDLGDKPTDSLIKFAKQLGTIPVEILKQVDALELQGKKSDAAALAQKEYAKAIETSTNEIKKNMGTLPKLFLDISEMASKMWDSIMNLGREDTTAEKINKLGQKLQTAMAAKDPRQIESRKPYIAAMLSEIDLLQKQLVAEYEVQKAKTKGEEDAKKFDEDRKKRQAMGGFNLPKDLGLEDLKTKYSADIKTADSESNKLISDNKLRFALGLKDVGEYLSDEMKLIIDQNDQKIKINNTYMTALETARSNQEAKIRAEGARAIAAGGADKRDAETKKMKDALDQLNETYKNLTVGVTANNEVLADKSIQERNKALEQLGQYTKKVVDGNLEFQKSIDEVIQKRQLQMQIDQQLAGLSGVEYERTKAQIEMQQSHVKTLGDLEFAANKAKLALAELAAKGLDENSPEYAQAQAAITAAQTSLDKARAASRLAIVKAGTDAEITYYNKQWERVNLGVVDALVTAFNDLTVGGKNFTDVVKNLEKAIVNLITQLLVLEPLKASLKSMGNDSGIQGWLQSTLPSVFGSGGTPITGMTQDQFQMNEFANGGAFNSGVQAFANGGTFTNSVVSSPTLFKFASGTGLMGEAGPEAIMPLKRGSNGSLGVQMHDSGSSKQAINVVQNFTIQGHSADRQTQSQLATSALNGAKRAMIRNS